MGEIRDELHRTLEDQDAENQQLKAALRDIWGQCNDHEGLCVDGVVEAIQKHAPDFYETLALGPQAEGGKDG